MGRPPNHTNSDDSSLIPSNSDSSQKICHWCGEKLTRRPTIHSNPFHIPPVTKFCSRDCLNAWVYAQQKVEKD